MNSFAKGVQIMRLEKLSTKLYIVKLFFQKNPFFFPISPDRRGIQVFVEAVAPCFFRTGRLMESVRADAKNQSETGAWEAEMASPETA